MAATQSDPSANKSDPSSNTLIAYMLLFIGGFSGLHHLYLGRVDQAALWAISGGGFGFGLLRDLWRMPAYARLANGDDSDAAAEKFKQQYRAEKSEAAGVTRIVVPISPARLLAEYVFGNVMAVVIGSAVFIPSPFDGYDTLIYTPLSIFGASFGVWFVGQVGEQTGSFQSACKGAAVGSLLDALGQEHGNLCKVIAALFAFNWSREYRTKPSWRERRGTCGRLGAYMLLIAGFWALLLNGLLWHGRVHTDDGEVYYLRDSVQQLLRSDFWEQFEYQEFFEHTSSGRGYEYFAEASDIKGVRSSLRLLEFSASEVNAGHPEWQVIKMRYRELVKVHHPDKGGEEKRFMEIQGAYEILKKQNDKVKKVEEEEEEDESNGNGDTQRRRQQYGGRFGATEL